MLKYKNPYVKYCCYCGEKIIGKLKPTKEHIVPTSIGGINLPINILPCCHLCNRFRCNHSFPRFKSMIKVRLHKANKRKDDIEIYKYEAMLVNIDYVEEYALSKGKELYKFEAFLGVKVDDEFFRLFRKKYDR